MSRVASGSSVGPDLRWPTGPGLRVATLLIAAFNAGFAVVVLVVAPAFAHDLARSESRCTIQGADAHCQLIVDLLEFPGVDEDGNGIISYTELDRSIAAVFAGIKEHFVLRGPAAPSSIRMIRHDLVDEHTARLDLAYTFPTNLSRLQITASFDQLARRPDHQHYVTTTIGGVEEKAILDASRRTVTFEHQRWTRTSIGLTVAALLLVGGRVGWFVFRKGRRATS
jgi:hypothetical protein